LQRYTHSHPLHFYFSLESVTFDTTMELLEKFNHIRLLAFDLDGVLTNGKLLLSPDGEWMREMDIKDGFALQHAIRSGFYVAVVSGSSSLPVRKRLEMLGITLFYENVHSKSKVLGKLMEEYGLEPGQVLFMGDDIPDLDAFKVTGLRCCPADAVHEVKERADYISHKVGGDGAARDVIEKVLRVQDKWLTTEGIQSI